MIGNCMAINKESAILSDKYFGVIKESIDNHYNLSEINTS